LTLVTEVITFTLVPAHAAPESTENLSGKRYGEVLLVTPGEAGPQAAVYNSYPLNDLPDELWSALDAKAIATENGAATALLNGPRYWLMNSIEKASQAPRMVKNFGGIDMLLQATVLLSAMDPAPYTANQVQRHTVFTYDAGEEIYELHDPALRRWVMQTWSQIVDPNLSRADLPGPVNGFSCRRAGLTSRESSPARCGSTPRRTPRRFCRTICGTAIRCSPAEPDLLAAGPRRPATPRLRPPLEVLAEVRLGVDRP
jgi:hypothetical protein